MKKIAASFASSDGCTPMPAMPNQRRALLTGALKSTATRRQRDDAQARPDEHRLAVVR